MSKLKTTDIKTGGGGSTSKTLQPGNQKCKINGITLEDFKFRPGAYHLVLSMEGPDLGKDFEGFYINKDKPELGRHLGQVGNVKAGEWAFSDGETKAKVSIKRDVEILKFVKNLCIALDIVPWLDAQDNKHDTIESLIQALNKEKPFKDKFLNCCIGGKEYKNKQGYINHELFFPKYVKGGVPFEPVGVTPSKVIKFSEAEHIKKRKVEEVAQFGTEDDKGESPFKID